MSKIMNLAIKVANQAKIIAEAKNSSTSGGTSGGTGVLNKRKVGKASQTGRRGLLYTKKKDTLGA